MIEMVVGTIAALILVAVTTGLAYVLLRLAVCGMGHQLRRALPVK